MIVNAVLPLSFQKFMEWPLHCRGPGSKADAHCLCTALAMALSRSFIVQNDTDIALKTLNLLWHKDSNPESGELFKVNAAAIFDNQE